MFAKHTLKPIGLGVAFVVFVSVCGGCGSKPPSPRGKLDALSQFLSKHGYTPYSPFRTDDKPGTLFVIAANHLGQFTELTYSKYDQTFDVPGMILFDGKGEDVGFARELNQTFELSGSAGAEILHLPISATAAGNSIASVTMKFGNARKFLIPIEQLSLHIEDVETDLRERLKTFAKYGQITDVYLVTEALEVDSLEITVKSKRSASGKAELAKIKDFADVNAAAKIEADYTLTIKQDKPMLIAYKAIRFPEKVLRSGTSASDIEFQLVMPSELRDIKRGR